MAGGVGKTHLGTFCAMLQGSGGSNGESSTCIFSYDTLSRSS